MHEPNNFAGTPTMFNDILTVLERERASGEHIDLSALQYAVNGGATIPPALMNRMFTELRITKAIVWFLYQN